jgi:hypothetical protein
MNKIMCMIGWASFIFAVLFVISLIGWSRYLHQTERENRRLVEKARYYENMGVFELHSVSTKEYYYNAARCVYTSVNDKNKLAPAQYYSTLSFGEYHPLGVKTFKIIGEYRSGDYKIHPIEFKELK